ncbi:hypothetical protein PENTCL1PPCAC_9818 [Pristionchus entomophagus]|uniref:Uncharacterized protein n=1 Tax=Pristionchus entomophagus TaxID=358040 RepID=A0AAV5T478_9BILA|nr:hypothetical protein PENTCL1PPCAC_9818 [Pristionchus entomophagus]
MLKVFNAGGMRKDLLTVMEWNYSTERRLLAIDWAEYYPVANAEVDYLSDSDFEFDRDEDDDAVVARDQHESAVENEFNAFRSHLHVIQNQVPNAAQSRAAAVAAGFVSATAHYDNEDAEDPASENEDEQVRETAEAAVQRIIADEKAEADIACRVRQRLLDSPIRLSSDSDEDGDFLGVYQRDISRINGMYARLDNLRGEISAVYGRRRVAIAAARETADAELAAIRERRRAESAEVRQRRRSAIAAIRASSREEITEIQDRLQAEYATRAAALGVPERPRLIYDGSPDRFSVPSITSFSTISSVSSFHWDSDDDQHSPVRRERQDRAPSDASARYREMISRISRMRESLRAEGLGGMRGAGQAAVAAPVPDATSAAGGQQRGRVRSDSESDTIHAIQPPPARRYSRAALRAALALSSSSEDEAIAAAAAAPAANRRRRRPVNDADSDSQPPPVRRRLTRGDNHTTAADRREAASAAPGGDNNPTAAFVGVQTRRRAAAAATSSSRSNRGPRTAQ